ncbi:MAG TPA: hypothetical protein VF507_10340, partial [Pyrinomonadaceae bacterium]
MRPSARARARKLSHLALAVTLFVSPVMAQTQNTPQPPVAAKIPKELITHGDKRVDNYFWFRE